MPEDSCCCFIKTMKNIALKMFSMCICACMATAAQGQADTLFWFAAPEISNSASTTPAFVQFPMLDRPIILRLTTYGQPATVTISQPAGGGMPVQTVNISANSTQNVDLTQWIDFIENKPPDVVLNYGLKISSTALITAYYDNVSGGGAYSALNPEAFILKGQNALGTEFWIPGQNYLNNGSYYTPAPASSSFDIVATENNTTVTITTANAITGHAAGTTFTVTLNEGQTYSATATSQAAAMHVHGSKVVSDKPVAVTVKDDLLSNDVCADLSGDQIIPVRLLGTEYIAIKGGQLSTGDQLFITATQNGTDIVNNGSVVTTINEGQTYRMGITGSAMYVTTSHPAYVWQVSGIGCEVGAGQLPQIRCSGSTSVSFTRINGALYLNLLVQSGGQGNFLINGAPGVVTSAQFSLVAGTTDWYSAQVSLPLAQYPSGSVISITNTSSLFHVGILNGDVTGGTSYGYFSSFSQAGAPAQPSAYTASSVSVCQGQNGVTYTVPAVSGAATYEWSYSGNGATFTGGASTTAPTNTVNFSGSATDGDIQVAAKNSCGTSATRDVTVTVGPVPVQPSAYTTSSVSVCQGQNGVTYAVPAVPGATTYEWSYSGSGATFSGGASTTAPTNNVDFSGSATGGDVLVAAKNSCGTGTAQSVTVTVNIPPVATVSPAGPAEICEDDSVTLTAGTGTGYSYEWKRNGIPAATGGNTYTAYAAGNYKVVVTGPGSCKDSTQEVSVTVYNRPSVSLTPGDTAFCEGGTVTLQVSTQDTGLAYHWKNGAAVIPLATADFLEVINTGVYKAVVARSSMGNCEDSTNEVIVTVYPTPFVDVTWDGSLLHATQGYVSYQWNTGVQGTIAGATDSTFRPSAHGSYSVSVVDSNGCSSTSPVYNVTVGVEDAAGEAAQVNIYPNPVSSVLYIEAAVPVTIMLNSMDGKVLLQQTDAHQADMSGYADGVYLLRILDRHGVVMKHERIIKRSSR